MAPINRKQSEFFFFFLGVFCLLRPFKPCGLRLKSHVMSPQIKSSGRSGEILTLLRLAEKPTCFLLNVLDNSPANEERSGGRDFMFPAVCLYRHTQTDTHAHAFLSFTSPFVVEADARSEFCQLFFSEQQRVFTS